MELSDVLRGMMEDSIRAYTTTDLAEKAEL